METLVINYTSPEFQQKAEAIKEAYEIMSSELKDQFINRKYIISLNHTLQEKTIKVEDCDFEVFEIQVVCVYKD